MSGDDYGAAIIALLEQVRTGFLATTAEHGPETSMAPFALFDGSLLLHLSGLARHSKNLLRSPRAGLMICTPEVAGESVLALPRLSLQGEVAAVPEERLESARASYLYHIPDAEPLFDFPDFRLCMLRPGQVYWVGGFGSAREITLERWHKLTAAP